MSVVAQGSINQSIVQGDQVQTSVNNASSNLSSEQSSNQSTNQSNESYTPSDPSCTIVISNIDPVITLNDLTDVLRDCGTIKHAQIINQPVNQSITQSYYTSPQTDRVCLIEFSETSAVESSMIVGSLNVALGEKVLVIERYTDWSTKHSINPATNSTIKQSTDVSPAQKLLSSLTPPTQSSTVLTSIASPQTSATIYVGNLSPAVNEDMLHQYFNQVGPVAAARIQSDVTGMNRYAFVEFLQPASAERAMSLHGALLLDRNMKIGPASNSSTTAAKPGVLAQLSTASPDDIVEKVTELSQVTGADPSKLTTALAKVAEAQRLVAMKMGVALQQPLPDPKQILTVAEKLIVPNSTTTKDEVRSRTRHDSRDRGRSRSRSSDRHRSSNSHRSRSRRSRSRSRSSDRRDRHSSSRHSSHRSRRYSRSRSTSRSPSRRHSHRSSRRRSHSRSRSPDRHHSRRDRYPRHRDPKPDLGPNVEMVFDGFNWTAVPVAPTPTASVASAVT